MANYVANIHEALTATINAICEAQTAMYAEANQQRQQLRDLLASMRGHARAMSDLGNLVGEASVALYDIGERMNEVADVVHDSTLDFSLVPEGDYQGLVGFCEECGREVRVGDNYEIECGEIVCADCVAELEQLDDVLTQPETTPEEVTPEEITPVETEPTESEQLTIDDILPETEVTGPTIASDVLA